MVTIVKESTDTTVNVNEKIYYVDTLPKRLQLKDVSTGNLDILRVSHLYNISTLNIYLHKNIESVDDLASVNGFFDKLKQPTKSQVQDAMILIIDSNYTLKAGGGSMSDSEWSSSYCLDIVHPQTGLDAKVVVMKKYSRSFEDVLITAKEITECYKEAMTAPQKKKYNQRQVVGLLRTLLRNEQGFSVHCVAEDGKHKIKDKTEIKRACMRTLPDKSDLKGIGTEINRLKDICLRESNETYLEQQSTDRNKSQALNKIKLLDKLFIEIESFYKSL